MQVELKERSCGPLTNPKCESSSGPGPAAVSAPGPIGDLSQPALMKRDYFSDMPDADARRGDFEQPLSYPPDVPKPIIAGINGAVASVGLCFALFCDIRFIASDAKVTTAFARHGLIAEYGSA